MSGVAIELHLSLHILLCSLFMTQHSMINFVLTYSTSTKRERQRSVKSKPKMKVVIHSRFTSSSFVNHEILMAELLDL